MSDRTIWASRERFEALVGMIAEDGATPAGDVPGPAWLEDLQAADLADVSEVAQAHKEGRSPPGFSTGGQGG